MNIEKAPIVNLDGVMNKSLRIQMQAILQQQADEHYQYYIEQYEAELKKVYLEGKAEAKQEFVKWLENHEQFVTKNGKEFWATHHELLSLLQQAEEK